MICYVYIIQCNSGKDKPIKIGVANSPESRLNDLQTGSPYDLILISKIEMPSRSAAYNLESWLHKRFVSARMQGEWFNSSDCNLKRAFGVWNKITKMPANVEKTRVHANELGSLLDEVKSLRAINSKLKGKVRRLEREIDEYLDDEIIRGMP